MLKICTQLSFCTAIALSASSAYALDPSVPPNNFAEKDNFQILVQGNTISWGDETFGYMQVQNAQTYESLCEFPVISPQDLSDDTSCLLAPGTYNVTNHTSGQRIEGLTIGDLDGIYTATDQQIIRDMIVRYDPVVAIDAQSIYRAFSDVPKPANLYADVYSASAAELFWDREEPGLTYTVLIGSFVIGTTDGTSFFLNQLQPRDTVGVSVVASNASGVVSETATVTIETPDDGSVRPATFLQMPTRLTSAFYSPNTLELFWDRQGPGQLFKVFDGSANLLTTTDGISFFITGLPPAESYIFNVVAVDSDDNKSEPAVIVVRVDPDNPG